MKNYKILFFGDVVGKPGRMGLTNHLLSLKEAYDALFVIVNGENSASGSGINSKIANEIFEAGADVITLGNHAFRKREIISYFSQNLNLIRPANMPFGTPGRGWVKIEKQGIYLTVINLCGRVFMDLWDDPFAKAEKLLKEHHDSHIFIDFHAEATSEKLAFGRLFDGRVTAVVGTHTHVTTADEQIFPEGTAYITDVGMCGPSESILGADIKDSIARFTTALKGPMNLATGEVELNGVLIQVDYKTGKAISIDRINKRLYD